MSGLVEQLTQLPAPLIAAIIGLLALLETAAFAGLAVPGETAVVLGGVVAFEGRIPVAVMAASAVVGAILGDSIGFYLGRRLGTRVLDGRIGRLIGRERVDRSMARIRAGGIKAVILGRFVGVLRAVMPFTAGASGMRYSRFLVASVLGATAWGTGFTLLGYFAGNSWQRIEGYVGRASTVLAVVLVTVVVLVVLARKAAAQQERVRGWWQGLLARPRVHAATTRYARQISFLVGRFRPGPAAGLQLTFSLGMLALLGWASAVVVRQALGGDGLLSVDEPVLRALAEARTEPVDDIARVLDDAFSPLACVALAAVVGLVAWAVDRRSRALVLLLGAVVGAAVLADVVQGLVARTRDIVGLRGLAATAFPSAETTVMGALAIALLVVAIPRIRRWPRKVVVVTVVTGLLLLGGLTEVYLGMVYLSDAVGGAAFGALWGVAVATAVTTAWRPPRRPEASGGLDMQPVSAAG